MDRPESGKVPRLLGTIPNAITIVRLALLPVFVLALLWARSAEGALGILVLIGLSDWADGFLARRWNVVSRFGTAVDPVADRLTVVVVIAALCADGLIAWWVLAVVLIPDLLLAGLAALLFRGPPSMTVTWLGKWRTAFLLMGLPTVLLGATEALERTDVRLVGAALVLAGLAGHLGAALQYGARMVRLHRTGSSLR